VVNVKADVSEDRIAFIFRMKRVSELGTALAMRSVLQLPLPVNVVPSSLIPLEPEDGGDSFLCNIGSCKSHTASQPRRQLSSVLKEFKHVSYQKVDILNLFYDGVCNINYYI
jgi:hypothetical protein